MGLDFKKNKPTSCLTCLSVFGTFLATAALACLAFGKHAIPWQDYRLSVSADLIVDIDVDTVVAMTPQQVCLSASYSGPTGSESTGDECVDLSEIKTVLLAAETLWKENIPDVPFPFVTLADDIDSDISALHTALDLTMAAFGFAAISLIVAAASSYSQAPQTGRLHVMTGVISIITAALSAYVAVSFHSNAIVKYFNTACTDFDQLVGDLGTLPSGISMACTALPIGLSTAYGAAGWAFIVVLSAVAFASCVCSRKLVDPHLQYSSPRQRSNGPSILVINASSPQQSPRYHHQEPLLLQQPYHPPPQPQPQQPQYQPHQQHHQPPLYAAAAPPPPGAYYPPPPPNNPQAYYPPAQPQAPYGAGNGTWQQPYAGMGVPQNASPAGAGYAAPPAPSSGRRKGKKKSKRKPTTPQTMDI